MVQAQHEHSTVGSEPGIDSNESMIAVAADALSPALTPLQLLDINKIAAGYQKEGDCVRAVAAYRVLFDKARYRRVKGSVSLWPEGGVARSLALSPPTAIVVTFLRPLSTPSHHPDDSRTLPTPFPTPHSGRTI
jgi:hypothetical protein